MRQAVFDVPSQPIRNQFQDPLALTPMALFVGWGNTRWFGTGTPAGSHTDMTGQTDGPLPSITSYKRKTWTVAPTNNGDTGFDARRTFAGVWGAFLCAPGEVYNVSYWMRHSSAGAKNFAVSNYWFDANGVALAAPRSGFSQTTSTAGSGWVRMTATFTIPAGCFKIWVIPDINQGVGTTLWQPGDTLDVTGYMLTRVEPGMASTVPDYADPTYPGWAWASSGVANRTESAGYPYTLASIAGQPRAVNTTQGTAVSAGTIDPFGGRVLYTVYDVVNVGSAYTGTVSMLGNSDMVTSSGSITARTVTAAPGNLDSAVRPLGGTAYFRQVTGRALGRHVSTISVDNGLNQLAHMVDGTNVSTTMTDIGTGLMPSPYLTLASLNTDISPVAVYAYAAEHSSETRKRVSAWLARQYGAPIPAGY